jgi:chromosome segregation ATPase
MRLIDADAEIEKMSEEMTRAMAEIARWERRKTDADTTLYDIEAKIVQLQKNIVDCNKEIKILRLYNTAYDVEAVVKQLDEKSFFVATSKEFYDNPQDGKNVSDVIEISDAIEIVKGGGVEK